MSLLRPGVISKICHTTFAYAVNPYYDWHYDLALLICF